MKVSIITVVYNNESTISSAIESVHSQSYKNIEHIIIDGASTDSTMEIIRSYTYENLIVVSEKDSGLYDAMNKGINLSTGDLIGLLNSDDLFENNFVIEEIVDQFLLNSFVDVLYGDLNYVKKDDITKVIRKWKSLPYFERFFDKGNVPPHPTLYVKSLVYKKVGGFNLKFKIAADYEFMLRLFKINNFKSIYFPKVLVKMRLGGESNKNIKNIIKANKEVFEAWKVNRIKIPKLLFFNRIFKRVIQFYL